MRNTITICSVAVIVFIMCGLTQAAVLNVKPAGGMMTLGGGVYTSIQAAIDDSTPGDTIVVHSGTYKEQIVIWKAITLQGVGSATTIIDGNSGTGANVAVVSITAPGNVNFTDFTVKNAPVTNTTDLRFGILTNSSTTGVTYTISNNRVVGTNNPDAEQDYGIYGQNGGKENLVITNNVVTQTGSNNIVLETHQGTTNISYNTLDAGCYGVDAIFVMTHSGNDVANLQKISNNTINMGTGEGTSGATGISFAAVAEYYGVSPARFLANSIEINNNNISNLKVNRRGIGFWNDAAVGSEGDIISPLVSNNAIAGASGSVTGSMGIDTLGLVTDANITNNTITGVDYSFKERAWRGNIAAGTKLNLNCFSGNTNGVLTERTSGTLNAVNNSWGNASGPYHPITNPTGLGDKVSNNVDYYPWYPDCSFTTPAFKPVHNVTLGAYYDNIAPAVAAARNGDLITADAGTYNENRILIDKAVTIQGAGSTTTIIDGGGVTNLSGAGLVRITASTGNVIFSGFTVKNAGAQTGQTDRFAILAGSSSAGVIYTISNNKIIGATGLPGDFGFYAQGGKENLIFTYNEIKETGGNPVCVEKHEGPIDISYNNIEAGTMPENSDAVFVMTHSGLDVTNPQNITHNSINLGTGNLAFRGTGITIATGVGTTPGRFVNSVQIADNTIYGMTANRRGIGTWNDSSGDGSAGDIMGLVITRNTITGTGAAGGFGISLLGLATNAAITNNTVTNMDYSFKGRVWNGHLATGTVLNCNSFSSNNTGMDWPGPSVLNAQNNWWGNASGPSGAGGGSGDRVSTNVNFFPWLLSSGDCGNITLIVPDYVVDDDWAGLPDWAMVNVDGTNYFIGLNAFDTIQEAIAAASDGNNIRVLAGTYFEAGQIVIDKNLQILGADKTSTIIKPNHNTTVGGNVPSESWIYVPAGISFTLKNVTLDGTDLGGSPRTIHHAVQSRGQLTMENCIIRNIKAGTYYGRGVVLYKGTGSITKCEFHNIQRIGIHVRGNVESPNPVADVNKCLYVGKGDGDWLDYGVEFGGGGKGKVTDSFISDCTGVASVDGSGSAGILVTDYWGTGTQAEVYRTTITDCNTGIAVGYADEDASKLTANYNNIMNNPAYGVSAKSAASVDATYNWWGNMKGPEDAVGSMETDGKTCYGVSVILNADGLGNKVSEYVRYCPWLTAPISVSDGPCPVGDLDGDCDVDFLDFAIMAENWLVGVSE
jgi:hypothetical protein